MEWLSSALKLHPSDDVTPVNVYQTYLCQILTTIVCQKCNR